MKIERDILLVAAFVCLLLTGAPALSQPVGFPGREEIPISKRIKAIAPQSAAVIYFEVFEKFRNDPLLSVYSRLDDASLQTFIDRTEGDPFFKEDANDDRRRQEAKRLLPLTNLERKALVQQKYGALFDRIVAAEQKPFVFPKEISVEIDQFWHFSILRTISQLTSQSFRESLSRGDHAGAMKLWSAVWVMNERFDEGAIIASLVSTAGKAILLAAISNNSQQLSFADWQVLESKASFTLRRKGFLSQILAGELESSLKLIAPVFQNSEALAEAIVSLLYESETEDSDEDEKKVQILSNLKKLSLKLTQSDLNSLKSETFSDLRRSFQVHIMVAEGPISTWRSGFAQTETEDSQPLTIQDISTVENLKSILRTNMVALLRPLAEVYVEAVLKSRAQVKLLLMHARLRQFLWSKDRLPSSLEEVASAEEIWDDFSEAKINYVPLEATNYRLFSSGWKESGDIELIYRRPKRDDRMNTADEIPPKQPR